ncbi:GAF domain-containing protein [Melghirimyces algeriensis]|uniref:GAF domain-containing protein n=1 Tax=Melghirimyces algeriensis TaxID=910412 RepID=A0A521BJT9_9BACL|nr:GAF domain-containing protein [Melghirimyces algeriensis]SMO46940.1 GAF domain-containing protein [Melghirimyces algeriensis]
MDIEFIFKVIDAEPWLAYTLVGFGVVLAAILLWRVKNGDSVSLLGLNLQSDAKLTELEKQMEEVGEDSKQKSYVIQSIHTLAGEVSRLLFQPCEGFEDNRRKIYNYFLSAVLATMSGKKGNNPKVCIFVKGDEGMLKVHEAAAHSPDGMRKLQLSIADSAAGHTYRTGEIFSSGAIHTPGSHFKEHPKAQSKYHSLICVPIRVGDQILGVLSVTGDEEKSYSEDEQAYLMAYASILAPLLHKELSKQKETERVMS